MGVMDTGGVTAKTGKVKAQSSISPNNRVARPDRRRQDDVAVARRLLLPLAVVATMAAGLATTTSSAAASGVRIVSPANERFFERAPVEVKLETPRSVRSTRSIDLTLNRKAISGSLRRVRPGLWQVRLGRKQARVGVDRLKLSVPIGQGRRRYDSIRFIVGRRRQGLLTLAGVADRIAGIGEKVLVGATPERLIAKLNGKRLRWPLGIMPGRRDLLRLGADDGLHFGVNHLRVVAVREGGAFDVESRKIVIPRDRPLVGAGPDHRAVAGAKVRLDGTSSSAAAGQGTKLGYKWKIVRRPPGSKATLLGSKSARPTLPTDRPGTYRVMLTVTEPGPGGAPPRSASDVATVTSVANLPPIGEPIETMVYNGGATEQTIDTAIKIGSQAYPLNQPQGDVIEAVILNRDTLEPLYSASYAGSAANAETLAAEIKHYGGEALVVISCPELTANDSPNSAFVEIVKSLGASQASVESIKLGRAGWSLVGVPGASGSAYFGTGSNFNVVGAGDIRGNLSGYLQENLTTAGFSFVPASRVTFATSAPGSSAVSNKMTVGIAGKTTAAEYQSKPLSSCTTAGLKPEGGFQVVVLLAETLALAESKTYTTNGCGATADAAQLGEMEGLLGAVNNTTGGEDEGSKLVFVQSIGSPYDAGAASAWNKVAGRLPRLGGTASVFAEDRSSYALVGGLGIAGLPLSEASETLTGSAGELSGLLEPNREGAYMPMLSAPTGTAPFEVARIAYQPAEAWPDSSTAEEKAALAYAWELLELKVPEAGAACFNPGMERSEYLRAQYCNTSYRGDWEAKDSRLNEGKASPAKGFESKTWERVKAELKIEFREVDETWNLIKEMQSVFGVSGTSGVVELDQIAAEIEKDVAPPKQSEAAGWWLGMVGNLLSTASYYSFGDETEVAQTAVGTLAGVLFITAQMIFDKEGAPEAEDFKLETADFAKALAERYLDASTGLGLVYEILVTDHGKLTAIANLPGLNSRSIGKLTGALKAGSRQWSLEKLMPAAFEAVSLQASSESENETLPKNADEYKCHYYVGDHLNETYFPFHAPAEAQLRTVGPAEELGVLVIKGSELPGGSVQEEPRSPQKELLEKYFGSAAGAGLYAPWFWRSAYGYPSTATQKVEC
jgi:hypothetical protein